MGRILLIGRLAVRDLRWRPAEAVLLLLVIAAATTTLTMGLALHGVTSQPYQQTRAATAGPDMVASYLNLPPMPSGASLAAGLVSLKALAHAPGVTGHTGPYPVAWATLRAHGLTAGAMAEGRSTGLTPIDQPKLTQGSWLRGGGARGTAAHQPRCRTDRDPGRALAHPAHRRAGGDRRTGGRGRGDARSRHPRRPH